MVIGLIACLAACKKEQPQSPIPDSPASLQKLFNPAYQISTDSIHRMIRSYLDENKQVTPWDSALVAYYQEKDEFFWLNDSLVSDKPATQLADSLLYWLGNISKHGIHPGLYLTDSIRNDLEQIRTLQLQGKKTMNRLLADVEYRLTSAYLSYVCRLKFGFLPPERRWNDSIDRIPLKRCDKEFALAALDSLRTDANAAFRRAQPSSRFYKKMQEELERVNSWGETDTTDYHSHAGTVGTQHHGHTVGYQLLCGRGALIGGGLVVYDVQLDGVGFTINLDRRLNLVGVLNAQCLLLTAGSIVTGCRLIHTDLYNLVAGGSRIGGSSLARCSGSGGSRIAAARKGAGHHCSRQHGG